MLFGLGFLLFVKVAELLPKLSGLESYRAACKEKPLVGEKPCTRKQKLDYHQGGVSLVWFIFLSSCGILLWLVLVSLVTLVLLFIVGFGLPVGLCPGRIRKPSKTQGPFPVKL